MDCTPYTCEYGPKKGAEETNSSKIKIQEAPFSSFCRPLVWVKNALLSAAALIWLEHPISGKPRAVLVS